MSWWGSLEVTYVLCFLFLVWVVIFFVLFFCGMHCCLFVLFFWYELWFFWCFFVWIVFLCVCAFLSGMNCVLFLCFFCGRNCVFFFCFFSGMNCDFFLFFWYELCVFLCFFCARERRKSKKKSNKQSIIKSAFLWKKWNSGRLTSTAFGPAAQQMSHTISFFQPPFQKNLSGVSPCQERECEKM